MTNREKVAILREHFGDKKGNINLSGIDFELSEVDFSGIDAFLIDNSGQKAKSIYNSNQEVEEWIINEEQKGKRIKNTNQTAKTSIYNDDQESKLWISNEKQTAEKIFNEEQKADKIFH